MAFTDAEIDGVLQSIVSTLAQTAEYPTRVDSVPLADDLADALRAEIELIMEGTVGESARRIGYRPVRSLWPGKLRVVVHSIGRGLSTVRIDQAPRGRDFPAFDPGLDA